MFLFTTYRKFPIESVNPWNALLSPTGHESREFRRLIGCVVVDWSDIAKWPEANPAPMLKVLPVARFRAVRFRTFQRIE
jgi:hypothetical protein